MSQVNEAALADLQARLVVGIPDSYGGVSCKNSISQPLHA